MKEFQSLKLIERIRSEIIPASNLELLRLILSPSIAQDELESFLSGWNFDTIGATSALLMTFLMDSHPEMTYPSSLHDKLNRHLGFYIWKKSEFRNNCPRIFQELHNHGITLCNFKGGEVFQSRPNILLEMRDLDVIVERDKWKDAARLITKLGYEIVNWDNHSFDAHVRGDCHGLIDVHRFLPPLSGKEYRIMKDVLSRAQDSELWGVPCKTLGREDLVFTYLGNIYRNIVSCRRPQSIPCNIINLGHILKSSDGFDWELVKEDALRTGVTEQIAFAAAFVNSAVPHLIPDGVFQSQDAIINISDTVTFDRYIMCYLQAKSHGLSIRSVIQRPSLIPSFMLIRPLFTSMKPFRGNAHFSRLILFIARKMKLFSL